MKKNPPTDIEIEIANSESVSGLLWLKLSGWSPFQANIDFYQHKFDQKINFN